MTNPEERGRKAATSGFAHEHITAGILMKHYGNVSLVNLPLSPYDIVIVRKTEHGEEIIRVQVKTAKKSVPFTGGSRGGVDRKYQSGIKTYRQSTKTCDVVVGLHPYDDSFDLYIVPTILIEILGQSSISISKIEKLKNNYEMLENCKNTDFVISNAKNFGIIQ
ncbi:MAG: hypothetical protein ABR954_06900 [Dehalococcoidales bacterium]